MGFPFRVALPTYGYRMFFDGNGGLLGLAAEGSGRGWNEAATAQDVWADPAELAALVAEWTAARPALMQGLIWFRLPVEGDSMNWPMQTLARVMKGETPRPLLAIRALSDDSGRVDVSGVNKGAAAGTLPAIIQIPWHDRLLLAADGLNGYAILETSQSSVALRSDDNPSSRRQLAPGEVGHIGWLRLNQRTEVELEY